MSQFKENKTFVGRTAEKAALLKIADNKEAAILVMFGRRRVGKTELLEQTFRQRRLIKIEGIEGKTQTEQRAQALRQLSNYLKDPLIAKLQLDTWADFFELLYQQVQTGKWIVYFEEMQWLADYKNDFISELKYVWDNAFRHNPNLLLVLCGSAPSFMINQVLHSKALYNRSQYEFPLKPFTLLETQLMLKNKSIQEVMDAYLSIGGIPDYLKRIAQASSVYLGICENAFTTSGYLVHEQERIFTSSMSSNKHYKTIIKLLSKQRFLTRPEIAKKLKIQAGGVLSGLLTDLETCGFIEKYSPFNLTSDSKLSRYCITDPYLQFYFKFIEPKLSRITSGEYDQHPTQAINQATYRKWLGFAFERFCRKQHVAIATLLGFSGIHYKYGAFYNRKVSETQPGYQIDLVFDRDDRVFTICEIKYEQAPVGVKVIEEMERKLEYFPNPKNKTIQKILIASEGANHTLQSRAYFDKIITLEDFFKT